MQKTGISLNNSIMSLQCTLSISVQMNAIFRLLNKNNYKTRHMFSVKTFAVITATNSYKLQAHTEVLVSISADKNSCTQTCLNLFTTASNILKISISWDIKCKSSC